MKTYNYLLKRQLKKCSISSIESLSPEIQKLLALVNDHYDATDEDQALLEHSFEISSREYQENLDRIKKLQAQLLHNEKLVGIGQLSAGIAHEINNPLGYIISNMDTLKNHISKIVLLYQNLNNIHNNIESLTAKELREKCREIHEFVENKHLDFVFEDIHDLSAETFNGLKRIENIVKILLGFTYKGYENQLSNYDLNKGIRETLTIANNELKYHVAIIEEFENIPHIVALGGEMNQVLLNLIMNAGQSIKEKGPHGTIHIHTYADSEQVHCEIKDDGLGIPQHLITRIFDPFFTTKPVGIGTGLGLSIVHDIIVNKHRGTIDVNSEEGNGTTFHIALPIGE